MGGNPSHRKGRRPCSPSDATCRTATATSAWPRQPCPSTPTRSTNFNPVLREGYTLGAPVAGSYKEILNSDDAEFGGSGAVHNKAVRTHKKPMHGFEQSITITLPPMSTLYFEVPAKRTRKAAADKTDKAGKKTAAEKAAAKVVKKPGRKPKAEAAAAEEKPVKKTARKAKAEPEKAEEAPKKRGRKPKAEAEPKAEKAPAKRTRKPKDI